MIEHDHLVLHHFLFSAQVQHSSWKPSTGQIWPLGQGLLGVGVDHLKKNWSCTESLTTGSTLYLLDYSLIFLYMFLFWYFSHVHWYV